WQSADDILGGRLNPGEILDRVSEIPICVAPDAQVTPSIAFGGDQFLVVWNDNRHLNYDVYGSRVSTAGNVLDPGGIAICIRTNVQALARVASDNSNFLVVWEDQ